ncbi:hypothetical protein [Yaniella halotolerans]|uniref:hypothetical protein n=1 Tax=Yaniella halotolerans TaxID=225453 RepID=UPI000424C11F|nr:hypothetical protein [Yaniella halotolerans]
MTACISNTAFGPSLPFVAGGTLAWTPNRSLAGTTTAADFYPINHNLTAMIAPPIFWWRTKADLPG